MTADVLRALASRVHGEESLLPTAPGLGTRAADLPCQIMLSNVQTLTAHSTTNGRRVTEVAADALRVRPTTRIPVPIRDLAFADISSIELRHEERSPGKKVLRAVAIGAGIISLVAGMVLAAGAN